MKWLLVCLVALAAAAPASAQVRTEHRIVLDSLPPEQMREIAEIRERAGELSLEMDAMVAYLARDLLIALAAAPNDRIDLRSWNIQPVGFDRVTIIGSFFMARSGAPGAMRSYSFTITPEAAGPERR